MSQSIVYRGVVGRVLGAGIVTKVLRACDVEAKKATSAGNLLPSS